MNWQKQLFWIVLATVFAAGISLLLIFRPSLEELIALWKAFMKTEVYIRGHDRTVEECIWIGIITVLVIAGSCFGKDVWNGIRRRWKDGFWK